jgi:hypothetical protein
LCENSFFWTGKEKNLRGDAHRRGGGGGCHVQKISRILTVSHTFRNECGWADFPRDLCALLFNDDPSNEISFSHIHLAGQYL